MKSFHEQKRYSCSLCNYQAGRLFSLGQHKKSVHQGVKVLCQICGKSVSSQANLYTHVKTQHKGGKKNQCKECKIDYKSHGGLKYHTKSVHLGITHKCNLCEYSPNTKSSLNKHVKSMHFKERYPCKICDYEATRRLHLTKHIKNVHEKSEIVNCTECNKSMNKQSLKIHTKIFHSGEKPKYNCNLCIFQTNHQGSLSRHIETVHRKGLKFA